MSSSRINLVNAPSTEATYTPVSTWLATVDNTGCLSNIQYTCCPTDKTSLSDSAVGRRRLVVVVGNGEEATGEAVTGEAVMGKDEATGEAVTGVAEATVEAAMDKEEAMGEKDKDVSTFGFCRRRHLRGSKSVPLPKYSAVAVVNNSKLVDLFLFEGVFNVNSFGSSCLLATFFF